LCLRGVFLLAEKASSAVKRNRLALIPEIRRKRYHSHEQGTIVQMDA